MLDLSKKIVCDGEGISKLIEVNVINALNVKQASAVAFAVANSQLVKTAVAGEDANWGRVIMAIGKSYVSINPNKIRLKFGKLLVSKNGEIYKGINIEKLNTYMKRKIIEINIDLVSGNYSKKVYSSDLTHEYIAINADYRS